MKKGRSKYIIIIIILLIYLLGMYLLFGVDEVKKNKVTTTLLIGNSSVWNYSGRKWSNVTNNQLLSSLDWQKFMVYINSEKLGNYYLWNDDKWYVFDDDKKALSYSGLFFAYKADFDMKVLKYETKQIIDFTYVNEVLSKYNLISSVNYTVSTITSVDFNQDGVNEDFYVISNVFSEEQVDKYFSFVFMVKNEKIYMLYEDVDNNDGVNGCKPYINLVADVDNDKKNELVLTCARYSNQLPIDMLYKFEEDAFKIVISNQ